MSAEPCANPDDDLVRSAYVAPNAVVFAKVLRLHVPRPALIADVTYGRGSFWSKVPLDGYTVLTSDIADGVDCTDLPYDDDSLDAVVLDPPYVAGFFRPQQVGEAYGDFTDRFSQGTTKLSPKRYHAGVVDLFERAGAEAHRVLRPGGVLIAKCQDEVHAGRQFLTHVEIVNAYDDYGLAAKDLFVVMREGGNFGARGRAKRSRQVHARKNHSFFLVFDKRDAGVSRAR